MICILVISIITTLNKNIYYLIYKIRMKEIFIKIIIYLFEKFAFDYWVEKQQLEEKEKLMKKYNIESEEEFIEFQIEIHQQPTREAYQRWLAEWKWEFYFWF